MTNVNDAADPLVRFRNRLWPTALKIKERLGIMPEIIITQAAHESAWGMSELSRRDNNLFGMTASADWIEAGNPITVLPSREWSKYPPDKIKYWKKPGDIIEKMSDGKGGTNLKVLVEFCKYGQWEESMDHWADRISTVPVYHLAYLYAKAGDVGKFITAIAEAGYATDRRYASKLTGVYNAVAILPPFVTV